MLIVLSPFSNSSFKLIESSAVTSMETLVTMLLQSASSHHKQHVDGKTARHSATHCVLHKTRRLITHSQEVCFHQHWFSCSMQMTWRVNIRRLGVKIQSVSEISSLPLVRFFLRYESFSLIQEALNQEHFRCYRGNLSQSVNNRLVFYLLNNKTH